MITINKKKCIGCRQCIDVCPFTVLETDENGKPYASDKACIKCMHCAAICQSGAITFDNEAAAIESVQDFPSTIVQDVELLIKQRRSYRKFTERKPNRTEISRIISIADLSPSAKNQHPTDWIVIDSKEIIENMMDVILDYCREQNVSKEILEEYTRGNNPVLGENASVLIGYCMDGAINPAADTAIALTNIELLMQSRGIGTCWGGYLTRFLNSIEECRKLAGLPEGAVVYGTLLFGYPNQSDYRYVPVRKNKAKIEFI